MEPLIKEEEVISTMNPFILVGEFLASYGWYLVGIAAICMYLLNKLRPSIDNWKQAREDAEYHKDPDKVLSQMEAVQRARERQQQLLVEASQRAAEQQKEREEKKKADIAEKLKKLHENGGQMLGSEGDYMPLSGGAGVSSYRPPKRSKCSGGGCGR